MYARREIGNVVDPETALPTFVRERLQTGRVSADLVAIERPNMDLVATEPFTHSSVFGSM